MSKLLSLSQNNLLVRDTGIIEVSIALTGVSAAIMALVPRTLESSFLRGTIYLLSLITGFFSLWGSLWLLGEYAEDTQGLRVSKLERVAGIGHIFTLLFTPRMGPYWVIAVSLALLFTVIGIVGYASAF